MNAFHHRGRVSPSHGQDSLSVRSLRSLVFLFYVLPCTGSLTTGCQLLTPKVPESLGEQKTSYSYIPLDPLPVKTRPGTSCKEDKDVKPNFKDLLDSLPDQAVRIAVGQYDASGTLVYGPVKVGTAGRSYQIVLDYISVDAANVPVYVERLRTSPAPGSAPEVSVYDDSITEKTQYRVREDPESELFFSWIAPVNKAPKHTPKGEKVIIPVYLGVGLRLTASVTVTKGTANLSSLGAIAADAEAGKITGSLVVQTLGVTGKSVATTLPLPSELNQTTIQNAILSLGSIKAVLYDSTTQVSPRVVGIYNPIGGGQQVVNGIISILARNPILWSRPCKE